MRLRQYRKKILCNLMMLIFALTMAGINIYPEYASASSVQASLISPSSRQVFQPGSNIEIKGTAQGLPEVSVSVGNEQGVVVYTAQPEVEDGLFTSSFTLDSGAAEGEYTISLSGLGLSVKKYKFEVSSTTTTVELQSPSSGKQFKAGDVVEIAGTATKVKHLAISVRNSKNGRVYAAQPVVENGSFTTKFTLPAAAGEGEYTIYAAAAGMTAAQTSKFTVIESGGVPGGPVNPNKDVILTIDGNGVSNKVTYSLKELEEMNLEKVVLSATSDRPEDLDVAVEGIPLRTLLQQAGIDWGSAQIITFSGTDGYSADFTVDELFNQPRYIFPGMTEVEPMIALKRAERSSDFGDLSNQDTPVFCYGQRAQTEQTLLWFVKRLKTITVGTSTPGQWASPEAKIITSESQQKAATQGGEVESGSEIYLQSSEPLPRIYYTTDGSEPNLNSPIFNPHGCGPEQGVVQPIILTTSTTVKAMAVGRGKQNSQVMSLTFTVDGKKPEIVPTVIKQMVDLKNIKNEPLNLENGRKAERLTLLPGTLSDIEKGVPGSRLTISSTGSVDEVQTVFSADIIQKALEKGMLLGIDSLIGSYTLPLTSLNLSQVAADLGAKPEELSLNVVISTATPERTNQLTAQLQSGQQMLVNPVEFTVVLTAPNGKKTEYKSFGTTYVERELILNTSIDARQAVGAVWSDANSKFLPAPTRFETRDGQNYAVILSRSNSFYTVLQSPKTFADIKENWARNDIELLAAKMLVSGKSETTYEPGSNITRAEFASLLVRALGLEEKPLKEGQFKDVAIKDWYAGSVAAATAENIIAGYDGKLFKPQNNITREEMAVMIARAARVAGKKDELSAAEQKKQLDQFKDRQEISSWAAADVALAAKAGIISGMLGGELAPGSNADRAQSASILKRFLTYVNFMTEE